MSEPDASQRAPKERETPATQGNEVPSQGKELPAEAEAELASPGANTDPASVKEGSVVPGGQSVALPCASENAFGQNHPCPQEIGAELEMHQPRQREQQERWVRKLYSMCAHSTRAELHTK